MLYYYRKENNIMNFCEKKLKNVLGSDALRMDICKVIKTAENTKQKYKIL